MISSISSGLFFILILSFILHLFHPFTTYVNHMLSSTLSHMRLSHTAKRQILTTQSSLNMTKSNIKNLSNTLAFTSRIHRQHKNQLTFTPKHQQNPTHNLSALQKSCDIDGPLSSRSHRNSSRSSTKRKKKTHLFNFSPKDPAKPNKTKENFIDSFISTNKSQFVHTNTSLINSPTQRRTHNDSLKLKPNTYEQIRQKMKRLKNIAQMKPFKRRPLNRQTTEEEWTEIERTVRLACREEMKRVDTEETFATDKHPSCSNTDLRYEKIVFGESETTESNKSMTLRDRQQMESSQKTMIINQEHLSLDQMCSFLIIYQHILYPIPSITSKFAQICTLYQLDCKLAIYLLLKQMYLNKKIIQSAIDQHNDSSGSLEKELHGNNYRQVRKQVHNTNSKDLKSLVQARTSIDAKQVRIISENCLQLPTGNESMEELRDQIEQMKIDLISCNMKLIKKVLKKISNNPTTNTKHFHAFLNYTTILLNISRIPSILQEIMCSKCLISKADSSLLKQESCELDREKTQISQFLYSKCKLMDHKFISMKEKVFEMLFDIVEEHKKIQEHYHLVIAEVKALETQIKGIK